MGIVYNYNEQSWLVNANTSGKYISRVVGYETDARAPLIVHHVTAGLHSGYALVTDIS